MRALLSALPFVLCNLMAPDTGGAAGSESNADAIRLGEGATAPEITGQSLEDKVTSAQGLIGKLFSQAQNLFKSLAQAGADLTAAQSETARLQGLFDVATKEATEAKAESTRLSGELVTMTSARDAEKLRAEKSEGHVGNLEKLCSVKGINPAEALKIPAEGSSESNAEKLKAEYGQIKASEDKGDVPKGTASKFFAKHKKELNAA